MSPGSKNKSFLRERTNVADRKQNLWLRARMVQSIRAFFVDREYLEVETPQLISAPAPEAHIETIGAAGRYLQPSPELCMKRLLASGYPRIFQISKCFRKGERGVRHLPEFSLLEWYRTGIDYGELMEECEMLIPFVSQRLNRGETITYQGREIDLKRPWERLSVTAAFDRYARVSLQRALEEGRFDQVMVEEIEPHLGMTRPTFLYDYPACMAALARLKPGNETVAERFEIYLAGLELANGFSELRDPVEQRARFEAVRQSRRGGTAGKETDPMPESFLRSLQDMPEAAGIALGVDRLAMVFFDAPDIDHVVSFTPEEA
ncbi:MAG: EF-P lysine aminoacylase GenX [Deltaproteobacteria bacterium]|nr:EF-P lysine aminoacylase GenX [Deltaproteobacteria bacterium]